MTERQKAWIAWAIVAGAIVAGAIVVAGFLVPAPPQVAAPQVQATAIYPSGAIYFAEGGKSQVFQSGASGTYLSGAKLDARSGATVLIDTATITNATVGVLISTTNDIIANGMTARYITATAGVLSVVGRSTFPQGITGNITGTVLGNVTGDLAGNAAVQYITSTVSLRGQDATVLSGLTANYITATTGLSVTGGLFSGPVRFGYVASQADGVAITHGFVVPPTVCIVSAGDNFTATVGTIGATTFAAKVGATGPVYWMCGK